MEKQQLQIPEWYVKLKPHNPPSLEMVHDELRNPTSEYRLQYMIKTRYQVALFVSGSCEYEVEHDTIQKAKKAARRIVNKTRRDYRNEIDQDYDIEVMIIDTWIAAGVYDDTIQTFPVS